MIDSCPLCGETELSFVDRRFGHCVRDASGFGMRDRIDKVAGYHPGMARFPNDPKAHVDGPLSLAKRLDELKREGYSRVDLADVDRGAKRPANERRSAPIEERVKRNVLKRLNDGDF